MSSSTADCPSSSEADRDFLQQFSTVYDTALATIKRNGFSSPVPIDWACGIQTNFTKEFLDEIYVIALTGVYSECTTSNSPPPQSVYSYSPSDSPVSNNTCSPRWVGQPLPQYNFAPSYEHFFASLSSSSSNRSRLMPNYRGTTSSK